MIDIDAATTYLNFVEQRHVSWSARQQGLPQPWTTEPIVAARKFTNVFRILDHGSQFVLTDLIDPELSDRDQLMRLFLYRHTGKVEAWEALGLLGDYPTVDTLPDALEAWKRYRGSGEYIDRRAESARKTGRQWMKWDRPVFTRAYLVFPQSQERGTDKLDAILALTTRLFTPGSPDDIVPSFMAATDQPTRFAALRSQKGVGDFMSMQILTDWGYTPHAGADREDEFVVAGPGAVKGARALTIDRKPLDVIRWAQETVHASPLCPVVELPDGRLRKPSMMDVQNTLCEFSKYVRFEGGKPKSQPYKPAHPGEQPTPLFPASW